MVWCEMVVLLEKENLSAYNDRSLSFYVGLNNNRITFLNFCGNIINLYSNMNIIEYRFCIFQQSILT